MPGEHEFQLAVGSIVGRDHLARGDLLIGRPNQDGFAAYTDKDVLVAIVTDGCSSGDPTRTLEQSRNHVGAALGARLIAKQAVQEYRATARSGAVNLAAVLLNTQRTVLNQLRGLVEMLKFDGASFTATVQEYFLFTVVGMIITPDVSTIFSLGDGVYALNGVVTKLGPFPGNAPPYLAYGMINSTFDPADIRFKIDVSCATADLDTALIGCDGVVDFIDAEDRLLPGKVRPLGPLSQFWTDNAYFDNPDAVRRKLVLANSACKRLNPNTRELEVFPGLLPDDTTLVAVRRKPSVTTPVAEEGE